MFAMSGDPVHNGHVDIIERAASEYDEFYVGIGLNASKEGKHLFTLEDRLGMTQNALSHLDNVKVVPFKGLLVDYAWEHNIPTIVKSVRNEKDLEYEQILIKAGATQHPDIKTRFLDSNDDFSHVSSSVVKALKSEQGLVHELVPSYVNQRLDAKLLGQYVLGVTGEIGAGKSYISKKLEEIGKERGILVYNIELDYLPHQIYSGELKEPRYVSIRNEIVSIFGDAVGNTDGTINRHELGDIVFNDSLKLDQLNEIMKKPMEVRLKREMYGKKGLVLVNAALIAESNMSYLSNNNVMIVSIDKATQEERLKGRGLDEDQIKRRLESQYDFKGKFDNLDHAITSSGNGNIWTFDNPDGLDIDKLNHLFDKMIREVDIYGELRFSGLWERLGADGIYDSEYKKLVCKYSKGHRHYHTLNHIVRGLDDFEDAQHLMENPDAVLFAWYYHDGVMKRKSKVDEVRSADLAYGVAKSVLLDDEFSDYVKNLVLATRHKGAISSVDEKLISDIDLAILGKSSEVFDKYDSAIKEEYSWLGNPVVYNNGRKEILEIFLDRAEKGELYQTDFFRDKYQEQAKVNLRRAIDRLD